MHNPGVEQVHHIRHRYSGSTRLSTAV